MGRFLITPVALTAPLFAGILRLPRYALVAGVVAIATVVPSLLYDQTKPAGLDGQTSIWAMSRPQAQAVTRPQMLTILEALSTQVPADAPIGYLIGSDDWDFPLYGAHLTRHLVLLDHDYPFYEADGLGLHWALVDWKMTYATAPSAWKVVALDQPDALELFERI
jgi:hypothetical protein